MSWDRGDKGRRLQIRPLAEKSYFSLVTASQITLLSYWQIFLQIQATKILLQRKQRIIILDFVKFNCKKL